MTAPVTAPVAVYVPGDSAAVSVGADATAAAIAQQAGAQQAQAHQVGARGQPVRIVRNGSRGMFWLEPLVEVETAKGRIAYGPVTAEAVAGAAGEAGMVSRRNLPSPGRSGASAPPSIPSGTAAPGR